MECNRVVGDLPGACKTSSSGGGAAAVGGMYHHQQGLLVGLESRHAGCPHHSIRRVPCACHTYTRGAVAIGTSELQCAFGRHLASFSSACVPTQQGLSDTRCGWRIRHPFRRRNVASDTDTDTGLSIGRHACQQQGPHRVEAAIWMPKFPFDWGGPFIRACGNRGPGASSSLTPTPFFAVRAFLCIEGLSPQ